MRRVLAVIFVTIRACARRLSEWRRFLTDEHVAEYDAYYEHIQHCLAISSISLWI